MENQEENLQQGTNLEPVWAELKEKQAADAIIELTVTNTVRRGVVGSYEGIRAFIPATHLSADFIEDIDAFDLSGFVGKTLEVKIIELDADNNKFVLSHKKVVKERAREEAKKEAKAKAKEFIASLEPGQKLEGKVARLAPFGAFVELDGKVDGLLHISDMSWDKVEKPEDVVNVGDTVQVTVLKCDAEAGKLSLTLKDKSNDPWLQKAKGFTVGEIAEGKVIRLAPFGAFVELAPGFDGLVHISQLSTKRVNSPDEVLSVGDMVKAKVLEIKEDDRRLALSIKEVQEKEEKAKEEANVSEYQQEEAIGMTIGDKFGDLLKNLNL